MSEPSTADPAGGGALSTSRPTWPPGGDKDRWLRALHAAIDDAIDDFFEVAGDWVREYREYGDGGLVLEMMAEKLAEHGIEGGTR